MDRTLRNFPAAPPRDARPDAGGTVGAAERAIHGDRPTGATRDSKRSYEAATFSDTTLDDPPGCIDTP